MYKSITMAVLSGVIAFAATTGYADDSDATHKVSAQSNLGRGIVNKLDSDAGKINISHEPIKSLKWPKMTMDFNVEDKTALTGITPGMKVDFELTKLGGGYRITRIVPAKE